MTVATVTERAGDRRTLSVLRGHNERLVNQLIEKSTQPHIADELACPRDAKSRFASPESFDAWLHKGEGRSPYFLTGEDGDLAGIVWFGPEKAPESIASDSETDPNYTFAVRIYEGYTGKGSAKEFIKACLCDYVSQLLESGKLEGLRGIHLETNVANKGAEHLYNAVGWREVHRTDGNDADPIKNRITMVMPPETIAAICKDETN